MDSVFNVYYSPNQHCVNLKKKEKQLCLKENKVPNSTFKSKPKSRFKLKKILLLCVRVICGIEFSSVSSLNYCLVIKFWCEKKMFSCVLRSSQGFMHMKLSRTKENKYILGQNSCPFDSVPEIIHFYSSRKLPIKGAEHMSLLYPVAIRTL